MTTNRLAIGFLILEGIGALLWWGILITMPASRKLFMAPGAPDATLLAFSGADLVLFAGAALLAAVGFVRKRIWAWPVLLLHTGAACYATLYCVALSLFSGGGWLGTVLMAPCLVILPYFAWQLRPVHQ